MTPEHRQDIEDRLRRYWKTQARYRYLTENESVILVAVTAKLPSDSVRSASSSDMPRAGGPGEPTLRVVLTREALLERAYGQLGAELASLQEELVAFAELWVTLTPVERALVDALYWRNLTVERTADRMLSLADDELQWYRVPTSRKSVERQQRLLLAKIYEIWANVQK